MGIFHISLNRKIENQPWKTSSIKKSKIDVKQVIEDIEVSESRTAFDDYMKNLERKFMKQTSSTTIEPQNIQQIPEIKPNYPPHEQFYFSQFQQAPQPNISTFPRAIKYTKDGVIPLKSPQPIPRSTSPITRRVPSYVPIPRVRKYTGSPFDPLRPEPKIQAPLEIMEQRAPTPPPLVESTLGPALTIKNVSAILEQQNFEPKVEDFPHSFYPFKRPLGFPEEPKQEEPLPPLQQLMQERLIERKKSPSYIKALRETGGIEDALESIEDSLQRNEIRAIGASHKKWGYKPWNGPEYSPKPQPKENIERSSQRFPNSIFSNILIYKK